MIFVSLIYLTRDLTADNIISSHRTTNRGLFTATACHTADMSLPSRKAQHLHTSKDKNLVNQLPDLYKKTFSAHSPAEIPLLLS